MKKLLKILAGSWVIASLLMAFPSVVSANGNLTIVVKNPDQYTGNQSWFTYEKKQGETVDDIAVVKNLSDKPVKAHVYAVDATSNDSGSFILKLEDEKRTGIGLWTKVGATDTVTIPPQQSVDFPFHINVPQNIVPGQYFGGLVLEEIDDSAQAVPVAAASSGGKVICCTNILVKTRIGLRIYLTIPGIIKDQMEWSGFKTFPQNKSTVFQFEIKNTGNVALEPTATIDIFDNSGNQVDRIEKPLGESLPQTFISPTVTWEHQPLFGNFKATAKLDYKIKSQTQDQSIHGSAELGSKTINFTVLPWGLLLILLLCAIAGALGYWAYVFSQNQIRMNWEFYEVKTNDNIMSIAQKHHVDWKKLVHVNKLKAPYLISNGQKIRVPKTRHPDQQSLFDEKKHE